MLGREEAAAGACLCGMVVARVYLLAVGDSRAPDALSRSHPERTSSASTLPLLFPFSSKKVPFFLSLSYRPLF